MPRSEAIQPAKAVTRGPKHHFFGYYEKTPWDATGRYMLGTETDFMGRPPEPDDEAVVGLIDTAQNNAWQPLARTRAWHWQLGCSLQWLPGDPARKIIYNVRRDGSFRSVIHDIESSKTRELSRPIYALNPETESALSVNFARLNDTRPGYGYVGLRDPWHDDPCPEEDGVYTLDLGTGESALILSLARAAALDPRPDMEGRKHWFNHVQISPCGTRFAVLHRWRATEGKWTTRLLVARPDGSGLRCLADDDMVSHYDWRDEERLLAWARREGVGERYFLFNVRTGEAQVIGEGTLQRDGHCSYSPDRRWILTDEYFGADRMRPLILYRPEDDLRVDIGRFYAPPGLDGACRCDLHPRWSRDGRQVCIDSAHEGTRQIYTLDVSEIIER